MSGIEPGAMMAVCRIVVEFFDHVGNVTPISGTGFWIADEHNNYFVTNRHNVDAKLKLGPTTELQLGKVSLEFRQHPTSTTWTHGTVFAVINDFKRFLVVHPTADVAVFKNPEYLPIDPAFGDVDHGSFPMQQLADVAFLENSLNPMDVASFLGFPGKKGEPWWDQKWNFPISRTVNLASWPRIPFTNTQISTTDVALVSGLSFSGSSGSPVISHAKGLKVSGPIIGGAYVEPKVVGIMSGHWWGEDDPATSMFFHSGLSYFTRATSIRDLLLKF